MKKKIKAILFVDTQSIKGWASQIWDEESVGKVFGTPVSRPELAGTNVKTQEQDSEPMYGTHTGQRWKDPGAC